MPTLIWRGDAQPRPQVTTLTPANVEIGDTFTATINRKDITVTATAATVANVVALLVAAIGDYDNDIPEFAEISAASGTDDDGNVTHVELTGPTDGKPFTITTGTGDVTGLGVSVTTDQDGDPGRNEIQVVDLAGTPTGGTFTLTYDGQTTGNIAYNADAATVDAALEALSNIGAGDVTTSGSAGGPWTVEFTGALAATNVPLMTGNGANLTGEVTVSIATTTQGAAGTNEVQRLRYAGTIPVNWRVSFNGQTTAYIVPDATAAEVKSALEALSTIGSGNVSVTKTGSISDGNGYHDWTVTFVGALANANQNALTQVNGPITIATITDGNNTATNEVQTITLPYAPTGGTFTLTFSGQTTSAQPYNESAANLQTDLEALSTIGVGNIAVTRSGSGTLASPYVWTLTFQGTLASTDVSQVTASGASLTGSAVSVALTQEYAAAANEIQTVSLTGNPTSGNFTLTFDGQTTANIAYNAAASAIDAALEALSNIGAGDISVVGPAGGPWTVTFGNAMASADQEEMTGDSVDLAGSGTQTLVAATTTTPTGPNWFDDAENYTNGTAPASGDTVIFENNSVDCLYGFTLSAQTLAELRIMASYSGRIGLPQHTGQYYEYRSQYLAIGATLVNIGQGSGSGSGRIKLDTGTGQTTVSVWASGPSEDNLPSICWKGTHASNALRIYRGHFGAGVLGGEVFTASTIQEGLIDDEDGDATVYCGAGGTIATVDKSGGNLELNSAVSTSLTQRAGKTVINGSGAVAQLTVRGGTVNYNSTGTLGGNTVVCGNGILDFSQDMRAKTVTNPIEVHNSIENVVDPYKVVTSLILDCNMIAVSNLGENVRLTRGTPA